MSSRNIQIVQIEQKIERLQTQLEYLRKLDCLEAQQSTLHVNNENMEVEASE
jgi:hypothetical protein